jgi:ABC-type glutathione transport system ATPase component
VPLASVERDVHRISPHESVPSATVYTPASTSRHESAVRNAPPQDAVLHQIEGIRSLRLTSNQPPETPSLARETSTPSIHVTSAVPTHDNCQPRSDGTTSLVEGVGALRLESPNTNSPVPNGLRENRAPSPSRRGRSGSEIPVDRYQVELEDPPKALSHLPKIEDALASARTLTSRMASVLSHSSLHQENGSSIQKLHRQALELTCFQLPSSRIVGLVGDSGVGKSSLINSLLDKIDLAGEVGRYQGDRATSS